MHSEEIGTLRQQQRVQQRKQPQSEDLRLVAVDTTEASEQYGVQHARSRQPCPLRQHHQHKVSLHVLPAVQDLLAHVGHWQWRHSWQSQVARQLTAGQAAGYGGGQSAGELGKQDEQVLSGMRVFIVVSFF